MRPFVQGHADRSAQLRCEALAARPVLGDPTDRTRPVRGQVEADPAPKDPSTGRPSDRGGAGPDLLRPERFPSSRDRHLSRRAPEGKRTVGAARCAHSNSGRRPPELPPRGPVRRRRLERGAQQHPFRDRARHFAHFKAVTTRGGIDAMNAFVPKPYLRPPPEMDPYESPYRSGELLGYYGDWRIIDSGEIESDCKSSGSSPPCVRRRHRTEAGIDRFGPASIGRSDDLSAENALRPSEDFTWGRRATPDAA
jgi:hypothetical protein